jgi:hypothetical protein
VHGQAHKKQHGLSTFALLVVVQVEVATILALVAEVVDYWQGLFP